MLMHMTALRVFTSVYYTPVYHCATVVCGLLPTRSWIIILRPLLLKTFCAAPVYAQVLAISASGTVTGPGHAQ